jgi:hypothetical protein
VDADLEVGHLTEPAPGERIAQRQHVRAEAELEVDGRAEPARAAGARDRPRVRQVPPERLLDQDRCALGQRGHEALDLVRRHGDVEERAGLGDGGLERGEHARNPELLRAVRGRVGVHVEDPGHVEAEPRVDGQVRIADDAPRSQDHDGARSAGSLPALAQLAEVDAVHIRP